ncbi:hypothetical protein LCGC14_0413980 [marine sediment metagenome]|uniref:Uncharacterized protein n=1 Tax=marine sediment metagenome TaxID=412755 RepID=A0A0F9TAW5_9ZZZZ
MEGVVVMSIRLKDISDEIIEIALYKIYPKWREGGKLPYGTGTKMVKKLKEDTPKLVISSKIVRSRLKLMIPLRIKEITPVVTYPTMSKGEKDIILLGMNLPLNITKSQLRCVKEFLYTQKSMCEVKIEILNHIKESVEELETWNLVKKIIDEDRITFTPPIFWPEVVESIGLKR